MSAYLLLGVDDIKTLVRARDLCALHSNVSPSAAFAREHLTYLLKHTALDPAAKAVQIPEE